MKNLDQFTKQYSLQKTICFDLAPVGETKSFLEDRLIVQSDNARAENATKVKEYMDRYHKMFIESVLSGMSLSNLNDYADLYFKVDKDEDERAVLASLEESLRKEISDAFKSHGNYKKMFGKEMITELLPSFLTDKEELAIVASFKSFTTFFYDFYATRENIYAPDIPASSIAYRCIVDNLPKFLDNTKIFAIIKERLPESDLEQLSEDMCGFIDGSVDNVFNVEYFDRALTQTGIEIYNTVIGGYVTSDNVKVKGINEYIHHYNQALNKGEKKLPLMVPLHKQILSERETISFVAEKFTSDDDVLAAILEFYNAENSDGISLPGAMDGLKKIFSNIDTYEPCGIFVADKHVTDISRGAFGSWNAVQSAWNAAYDAQEAGKKVKNAEAYLEKRTKAFKGIKSFSLNELQLLVEKNNAMCAKITNYLEASVLSGISAVIASYESTAPILTKATPSTKKLYNDENAIAKIKAFIDAVKELERAIKPLVGTGKEENRDMSFYGEFLPLLAKVSEITRLYDRVRNYLTQKPYSKDKVKLTFGVGDFFSGWAQDFSTKGAHIIRKDEQYYLMIVDKKLSSEDVNALYCSEASEPATLFGYHFLKADNKMIPKMLIRSRGDRFAPAVEKHNLPVYDILDLYVNGLFKAEYAKKDPAGQKEALRKLIDYFKLGFSKHESFSRFTFHWKPTEEYNSIAEFYKDAERACYKLTEETISFTSVLNLVKEGKVYVFRFANKDFSPFSKGTPNLHTMYFKALFDKTNLENPVYKLNGGAEMYFRKASISKEEMIVHGAHYPISNKNPNTKNRKSVFDYDIIKDRRFTLDRFKIHIPITLNFGASGNEYEINKKVRAAIHDSDEIYVIGIDRGEKNLLFATVIDSKGRVVEQRSLNVIGGIDYHEVLDRKEKDRQKARRDFMPIKAIKENKKGYVDQALPIICELVTKYNAVIAMEDLNSEFKNNRKKIEKEIYQKFERMLIEKLNYLVFKNRDTNVPGGLYEAYQLTSAYKSDSEMRGQNGIIFYVPAWYTSQTCPVTGFTNLFRLRYTNINDAKDFFGRFNSIRYNAEDNTFEFSFNYSAFNLRITDYTDKWTVCSHGDRVHSFRDAKRNNEWTCETVVLTSEFKKLFEKFGMDYTGDIKQAISERTEKEFFECLITLFGLTVQVRNGHIGDEDVDYVISPCKDSNGKFYDSRNYIGNESAELPATADANDAYNIARKGLWAVKVLKDIPDVQTAKVSLSISNKDWLRFAQTGEI